MFFHSSLLDHAKLLAEDESCARRLICMDMAIPGFESLERWLSPLYGAVDPLPEGRPDDPVFILTTSGTTGTPKGVVHTNRSFEAAVANCNMVLPFEKPPRHLVVAPLAHAAGVYHWTLLALGAENILAPSADPELVARMIEEEAISVVFLPPTLIYMMLSADGARGRDYSSLRYVVYGAAPMSVTKLREAAALFGPVMTQFYGQSEALLMATVLTAKDHAEILADPALAHRIAAAGRESPLARVEIMGEGGALLPPGAEGEIVIRSEILLSHYHDNPQATEAARAFGWHHTGDIGVKDADGYVYVVDRKSDMIVSGAYNLYPGEIEQAVLAHPMIQNCAVVGVPDDKWGEAVLAAVELKPGCALDSVEFLAFCKAQLGSLKAPKSVDIWPSIPRNVAGKTLRREVRARYWQGRDRAI